MEQTLKARLPEAEASVGNALQQSGRKRKGPIKLSVPIYILVVVALVIFVTLNILTFNVRAFEIPSSAMEPTLLIGDHIFVKPHHPIKDGDIVAFVSPANPKIYLVKRVVGVPGDRIHLRDGALYRNGEKLNEPYVIHTETYPYGAYNPYRDNFPNFSASTPGFHSYVTSEWKLTMPQYIDNGDLVVPADSYFGMGDNRDVSLDSRYWGFIPKENIVGRPAFIYWSFKTPPDQYLKKEMSQRLSFMAHVVIHFFDETRWNRTFKVPR